MYMPVLARFSSRDPLAENQAILLRQPEYVYATNNPTILIDPSGFVSVDPGGNFSVWCWLGLAGNLVFGCCGVRYPDRERALQALNRGMQEADEYIGNDAESRQSAPHQALRHCIASGYLAILTNSCATANCMGTIREVYQTECEGQPVRNGQRGVRNNRRGLYCAGCRSSETNPPMTELPPTGFHVPDYAWATLDELIACCKEKLENGELDSTEGDWGHPHD
ncbi:MAG: hypothetical protein WEB58_12330 [Planctomycetaceae bacterium]